MPMQAGKEVGDLRGMVAVPPLEDDGHQLGFPECCWDLLFLLLLLHTVCHSRLKLDLLAKGMQTRRQSRRAKTSSFRHSGLWIRAKPDDGGGLLFQSEPMD
jgi:hypothetical protein